jgi:hypothetical protein
MGTNYYLVITDGHGNEERIHIGKDSCGWYFTLSNDNCNTFEQWCTLFKREDVFIVDENEEEISVDEMKSIITRHNYPEYKYEHSAEKLLSNEAMVGIKNYLKPLEGNRNGYIDGNGYI